MRVSARNSLISVIRAALWVSTSRGGGLGGGEGGVSACGTSEVGGGDSGRGGRVIWARNSVIRAALWVSTREQQREGEEGERG